MRLLTLLFLCALSVFGQSKKNEVQTGVVDARALMWLPPSATFASPPSSPAAGAVYIFTDASAGGTCAGGGTSLAACRWSGAAWVPVGANGTLRFTLTAVTTITLTHNLGTLDVMVVCRDSAGYLLGGTTPTTHVTEMLMTTNTAVGTFSGATTGFCVVR